MTVAPLRYLRRACHSQSADLSGREWTVCGRTPRDHPIVPIQNLSRSLADLDEMRIVTFPRIVLHGSGILLVRVPPAVFVQVVEEDPCPCIAAHQYPDDDHLRAAHSPAHGLPVPVPWMGQRLCRSGSMHNTSLCNYLQEPGPR